MTWTPPPPRAGHPYYMHDAIYAQPGALRLVTRGQGDLIDGAASRLSGMDRVLLSGIGTSWHATLVGELLLAHALGELPDQLALLLGQEAWAELAGRFADRRRYWFVGGGPNTATAYEAALKMSEANHATALGLHCEQFLHGPWAALESDDVVVLVAPPGAAHERCLAVARVAAEVGAPLIALLREDDRAIAPLATETIAIPPVSELLSPILTVVPLQLFTYHLALVRQVNPDTMRGDQPAHGRARASLTL